MFVFQLRINSVEASGCWVDQNQKNISAFGDTARYRSISAFGDTARYRSISAFGDTAVRSKKP